MTGGVLHGSVLGSSLFIMQYTNDIDVRLSTIVSEFADDATIGDAIVTEGERLSLQQT